MVDQGAPAYGRLGNMNATYRRLIQSGVVDSTTPSTTTRLNSLSHFLTETCRSFCLQLGSTNINESSDSTRLIQPGDSMARTYSHNEPSFQLMRIVWGPGSFNLGAGRAMGGFNLGLKSGIAMLIQQGKRLQGLKNSSCGLVTVRVRVTGSGLKSAPCDSDSDSWKWVLTCTGNAME
eukprot:331298-Chlamydomonas_euryale.AAC.1